jgi:BirA family transcriptional regulator, biotin operon repressor / biotin---[acetyl-CoA-carboxylase] ligase
VNRQPLDEQSLTKSCVPPWRAIEIIGETGSTNADLLSRAAAREDVDGVVRIAEHQTAGRGRINRSWSSVPFSQIALSVGVNAVNVPVSAWGWLPLLSGVAVVDAVERATGVRAALKWPNDVVAGSGKLAGILTEVSPAGTIVVVGIGVNVTLNADEVSEAAVTSLVDLKAVQPDRTELTRQLLCELASRVGAWRAAAGADAKLIADYLSHSATVGSAVRVIMPGGHQLEGTAHSIDEQGRLRVDADHQSVVVSAGDVIHLRAAQ